jgi:hypothetical protein
LPRNTIAPPAAPVKVIREIQKPTSAGDVMPLTDYDQRATRADVEQMLEDADWEQTGGRGSVSYWTRPGKHTRNGRSATLGHVADTVLSVFSTGDDRLPGESPQGKHYGPAALYAYSITTTPKLQPKTYMPKATARASEQTANRVD